MHEHLLRRKWRQTHLQAEILKLSGEPLPKSVGECLACCSENTSTLYHVRNLELNAGAIAKIWTVIQETCWRLFPRTMLGISYSAVGRNSQLGWGKRPVSEVNLRNQELNTAGNQRCRILLRDMPLLKQKETSSSSDLLDILMDNHGIPFILVYFEKRNHLFSTISYKVNENSARENNKDWQTKAQGSKLFIKNSSLQMARLCGSLQSLKDWQYSGKVHQM